MSDIYAAMTATQRHSLDAFLDFTQGYLSAMERLAQLNLAVTRNSIEQSSTMLMLCLNGFCSRVNRSE